MNNEQQRTLFWALSEPWYIRFSVVVQPLWLADWTIPGGAPVSILSLNWTRAENMKDGTLLPAALIVHNKVTKTSLSSCVIFPTCFIFLFRATTLFPITLCTVEHPISSAFYISIGAKSCFVKIPLNFLKNSPTLVLLKLVARERPVVSGLRREMSRNLETHKTSPPQYVCFDPMLEEISSCYDSPIWTNKLIP